jgi:TIR domain
MRRFNIFISYRHDDDAGFAGRLGDHLKASFRVNQVFFDVDSVDAGLNFAMVVDKQLAHCDVLLAVIGRDWITGTDKAGRRRLDDPRDFVRIEIEAALKQRKLVVPVLVQNVSMPRREELPSGLKPLAGLNAIHRTHERFRAEAKSLIHKLKQSLREAWTPPRCRATPPRPWTAGSTAGSGSGSPGGTRSSARSRASRCGTATCVRSASGSPPRLGFEKRVHPHRPRHG